LVIRTADGELIDMSGFGIRFVLDGRSGSVHQAE
jgi:hypothetical protein